MEIPLLVHRVYCGLNARFKTGTQLVYSTGFFGGTPRDVKNALGNRATPSLSYSDWSNSRAFVDS
jgi:hypothetical protein